MNFSWEIISDAGLSMGGWTIDDVCVYGVPAEPEEEEPVASGCAWSSSSASGSWMWLLLGAVGLARRKRE